MEEKAKLIYLAGPVRALGRSAAIDIRRQMEHYFMLRNMVTFNPPGAWGAPIIGADAIEATVKRGNDTILALSDLIAVIFIPGVSSEGTDSEVMLSVSLRIPILVVVHDRADISDAIAWANPLINKAITRGKVSVEFAVIKGTVLETITTISYEAPKEEVAGLV